MFPIHTFFHLTFLIMNLAVAGKNNMNQLNYASNLGGMMFVANAPQSHCEIAVCGRIDSLVQ